MAYTYAGEIPSCAFGFNSNGVVFPLNALPLAPEEATYEGICRNFISRDLLEASDLEDALKGVGIEREDECLGKTAVDFWKVLERGPILHSV